MARGVYGEGTPHIKRSTHFQVHIHSCRALRWLAGCSAGLAGHSRAERGLQQSYSRAKRELSSEAAKHNKAAQQHCKAKQSDARAKQHSKAKRELNSEAAKSYSNSGEQERERKRWPPQKLWNAS